MAIGFEGSPVISDETGALAYKAFLSGGSDSDGVYLYSAGTPVASATSVDFDPISGSAYVAVGGPRFGPGGDLYFVADVLQGEGGYVQLSAGGHLPFLRVAGDPVPGIAGSVFGDAGFPSFNGSGDGAFIGFFHVGDTHFKGIFRLSGDVISALVVSGQPAPGSGGGVFTPEISSAGPRRVSARTGRLWADPRS